MTGESFLTKYKSHLIDIATSAESKDDFILQAVQFQNSIALLEKSKELKGFDSRNALSDLWTEAKKAA